MEWAVGFNVVLLSEKQLESLACLAQRLFHRISPQYVLIGNNIMIILTLYPLTSVNAYFLHYSLYIFYNIEKENLFHSHYILSW